MCIWQRVPIALSIINWKKLQMKTLDDSQRMKQGDQFSSKLTMSKKNPKNQS